MNLEHFFKQTFTELWLNIIFGGLILFKYRLIWIQIFVGVFGNVGFEWRYCPLSYESGPHCFVWPQLFFLVNKKNRSSPLNARVWTYLVYSYFNFCRKCWRNHNSVSKLLPFEANEGINHESGPCTIFLFGCNINVTNKCGSIYSDRLVIIFILFRLHL